ncbi:MAG: hypothetical protein NVSMB51_21640 [Solirubrobacteraceae bacterium]
MRIAWFSPSAGTSGISEFSRVVLSELVRHAAAELWTVGPPDWPSDAPVVDVAADPAALDRLPGYDAVIYNMGNHLAFHREIYEISQLHPGIMLLHDRSLHHFFAGWYITHRRRPDLYRRRMGQLYGERGREVADGVLAGREERAWSHPAEVLDHAFAEDVLAGARGAIVHSRSHAASVHARWRGPLCELVLPSYPEQLAPSSPPPPLTGRRLVVMSTGHVERTKCLERVIEALAQDDVLAGRVQYEIVGPFEPHSRYVTELHQLIAVHGLAGTVALRGHQAPASFERRARTADIFVNLRMPNLEGGSASLMGQLPRGRPVLVYDSGCFSEVPDGAVVKVAPGAPLTGHLHALVDDAALRERIGERARAYAEACSVEPYVEGLLEFCERTGRREPLLALAERAGAELGRIGAGALPDAVARVSSELQRLAPEGMSESGTA